MSWALLGIPVGIVLLYFGSDWLVDGAKKLALRLGITPFVVGLTVVAFGSSAPEVITSIVSVNNPDIIIGNIVGSNIANIGLAIGLAAVLRPLMCRYEVIKFELISMMVAVILITVLSLNGWLGFYEGLLLIGMLFAFVYLVYRVKVSDPDDFPEEKKEMDINLYKCIAFIGVGLVLLYFGARWFVDGAVELAGILGVSELVIGLLVVAIGTSLPELCICLIAAWRRESDLVVSNIVGSIIFNSFFALGIGATLVDIPISDSVIFFHMPVMILMALILFIMVRWKNSVTRPMGAILLTIYATYVALMFLVPSLSL